MGIASICYAAFGYLTLLAAILWGMLFVGGGVIFPNVDAHGTAAPFGGVFLDGGLLLLPALLHRALSRGMLRRFGSIPRGLERSTQAWGAALVLVLIYRYWQPLPQVLWRVPGPLHPAFSALFYLAWTLIMIGAFLASHLDLFEIAGPTRAAPSLRQPLYWGIVLAVWATPVMNVGHLLLASAVTAYLLFDGLWAARMSAVARKSAAHSHSSVGASRVRALSGPSGAVSDTAA